METKDFATQAGHWYDKTGAARYTIVGKNGKERNTTLRDARTDGLLPSVTTIIRSAAAPGLEKWKQNNILMAALTLPRIEGETLDSFAVRCVTDANEQSKSAMQKGTDIHGAIEIGFNTLSSDGLAALRADYLVEVKATIKAVTEHFGVQYWLAERSFACVEHGYGGKLDLHAKDIVIDFKTKEFTEDAKKLAWEEQAWQLAAYREGLAMPEARCANVYISTTVPGLVRVVEWSQDELGDAWECFYHLLRFWQAKNHYCPNEATA